MAVPADNDGMFSCILPTPVSAPARVLIVDDSRIFRCALEEALGDLPDVKVVGSVFNGAKALEFVQNNPPDVVTLDLEMPGLNGLDTLAGIQKFNASRPQEPPVGVIMVSAYTRAGADVTLEAIRQGAFDFVMKPCGSDASCNRVELTHQLMARIRAFMARRRGMLGSPTPLSGHTTRPSRIVQVIAVAASTGGPRALERVLPELCRQLEQPIFVVQHMPAGFTHSLAQSLDRHCAPARVIEARDADLVEPRTVYVAPGGRHLLVRSVAGQLRVGLTDQPPENGFRPSADVLFRSLATAYGSGVVAVVLTGLSCGRADGIAGLGPLKRCGGVVIAQDEASSVVWGMPGAVVEAGLADLVLPIDEIASAVVALSGRPGNRS